MHPLADPNKEASEHGTGSTQVGSQPSPIEQWTIGERQRAQEPARDAIALLKADHRQVEGWFEQFEKARSASVKQELATKICNALRAHTTIEEEIFYPAFLEATEDKDLHHEAEVEHNGAKKLIAEIESADASDDYFDAKVTVLSEMIKHHVKEEEQRGGMFAEARARTWIWTHSASGSNSVRRS